MNILGIEEILEIYSYLRHLQISSSEDEKKRLEDLLEKLKVILLEPPSFQTSSDSPEETMVLIENMECQVLKSLLYDDVRKTKEKQDVLVTIIQDQNLECFRIIIEDNKEEPFEIEIDEIDLNIEEKKIICYQDETDSFEIFLKPDFIETLTLILNSNCNSSNP
jgi:hypothetical protein